MLEEAKYLVSKNISVIPIKGRSVGTDDESKKPAIPWKTYQQRLPTIQETENWFKFSRFNMAMVTGKISNIFCLDLDKPENSLNRYPLPLTWKARSPRGFHHYYKWHPMLDTITTTTTGILPNVDTRGEGGYVIIPPSVGFNGMGYEWLSPPQSTPLAYPPLWLINLLRDSTQRVTNRNGWVSNTLATLSEGTRNNGFTKIVGRLWYDGLSREDIFSLLKPKATEVEFPEDELLQIIESITKRDTKQREQTTIHLSEFLKGESVIKWVIDGVVPQESITILGGQQGIGKTWVLLDMAIEMAKGGGSWCGMHKINPASVLYIDKESSDVLLRNRLIKLLAAKNISPNNFSFHLLSDPKLNFNNYDSVEKFKQTLAELNPQVVFIDSLRRANSAEENSSTELEKVFDTIKDIVKKFGISVIFADHDNKSTYWSDQPPSSNDLRGSNIKGASADCVIALRKRGDDIHVYHTKSRFSEAFSPFLVRIENVDQAGNKIAIRGY